MVADALAVFYTQTPKIERHTGSNSQGPVYADPDESVRCKIRIANQLVTTAHGRETVAVATLQCSTSTLRIPPGSRVTLPPRYGGGVGVVATEGIHDSGGVPTTLAYYEFTLERT